MAQYNFWTSQGFIQTSNLIKMYVNGTSATSMQTNFSQLYKYPLPDYTINTNAISYSNSTLLFGFNRGSYTFELKFHFQNVNDNYNNYRLLRPYLQLYRNGTAIRFDSREITNNTQIWVSRNETKPITHFFICQATSSSSYTNVGDFTIYPTYNGTSINCFGSTHSIYSGAFNLGFGSNIALTNTYQNSFNPSSNNTRIVQFQMFIDSRFISDYTQISDYDTHIEWYCGKSVKYVGDDDISTTGGGFGVGQEISDTTVIPDTSDISEFNPTYDIANSTSFFTHYICGISTLQSVATHLFDTSFINSIKYLNEAKPLSCIISLRRLPFEVTSDGTKNIFFGDVDTEINTNVCKHSYQTIDCGFVNINEVWGNAIDYNPTTQVSIYLPFIGVKPLNTDDVMQSQVKVKYIVDILSGDLVAFIEIIQNGKQNVLYSYTGNCSIQYPLASEDYSQILNATSKFLTATATGALLGGMAGAVAGELATVTNVMTAKNEVQHSSAYSGNTGFMGILKPYVIIHRPIQSLPKNVENYVGFPSNISYKLSDLTGYTKVSDINLECSGTSEEKNEIIKLLKDGVIL